MTEPHVENDGAARERGSFFARVFAKLGLQALGWALPRLAQSERMTALRDVQRRTIATFSKTDALARRRYAAKSLEACIENASPDEQPEMLTGAARRALQHIDSKHVLDACSSLTNLVRLHPRLSDPASLYGTKWRRQTSGRGTLADGDRFRAPLSDPIPTFSSHEARHLEGACDRDFAGGVGPWYSDIAGRYLDILDVMTPAEFHLWTSGGGDGGDALEGFRKPFAAGPFETNVLDKVLKPAGIDSYQVIMPSAMYGLYRNVWRSRFGTDKVDEFLAPALIPSPEAIKLPFAGPYVAAKFYHSPVFPKTRETELFAADIIRELAARSHVVLLSNAAQLDDHATLSPSQGSGRYRVYDASELYGPRENLAKQTAIVAHAKELHGTYGGFSYLGPLLGVDTVAYVGKFEFLFTHLDLAWTTFDKIGGGKLAMMPAGHRAWHSRNYGEINEAAETT